MNKWPNRFMVIAQDVATWSKDPKRGVGAVIVKQRHIIATGYNGLPKGVIDISDIPKERKLLRTIHAELNAILDAKQDLTDCDMYCTYMPCAQCMAAIIQSGIATVYLPIEDYDADSPWQLSWKEAETMASEAGVEICLI